MSEESISEAQCGSSCARSNARERPGPEPRDGRVGGGPWRDSGPLVTLTLLISHSMAWNHLLGFLCWNVLPQLSMLSVSFQLKPWCLPHALTFQVSQMDDGLIFPENFHSLILCLLTIGLQLLEEEKEKQDSIFWGLSIWFPSRTVVLFKKKIATHGHHRMQ